MFKRMIKLPFLLPIKFYQKVISPLLPHSCRFQPSCSQYMLEAIEIHGVIKGLWQQKTFALPSLGRFGIRPGTAENASRKKR